MSCIVSKYIYSIGDVNCLRYKGVLRKKTEKTVPKLTLSPEYILIASMYFCWKINNINDRAKISTFNSWIDVIKNHWNYKLHHHGQAHPADCFNLSRYICQFELKCTLQGVCILPFKVLLGQYAISILKNKQLMYIFGMKYFKK